MSSWSAIMPPPSKIRMIEEGTIVEIRGEDSRFSNNDGNRVVARITKVRKLVRDLDPDDLDDPGQTFTYFDIEILHPDNLTPRRLEWVTFYQVWPLHPLAQLAWSTLP